MSLVICLFGISTLRRICCPDLNSHFMTLTNLRFFPIFVCSLLLSSNSFAQNFEETWKEFLENSKISATSVLARPDKQTDLADYAKYQLINTNTSFCQSDLSDAEDRLAEIKTMDGEVLASIPGFVDKQLDLEKKIAAYYVVDTIWQRFLPDRQITIEELENVEEVKTLCEKETMAKYTYMLAYTNFCQGEIGKAKNIFEDRTLRLAEKTSLKIEDIEGLPPEVAKMKLLFSNIARLNKTWNDFLETGKSPGFNVDLPVFSCYPNPNLKALVLQGMADVCTVGPKSMAKIQGLLEETGELDDLILDEKIEELAELVEKSESNLNALNAAWAAFLPDSKVDPSLKYGYDYCSIEPLVKAYILDGYTFVCAMAEDNLVKIDSLKKNFRFKLDSDTKNKITELKKLNEKYRKNGESIDVIWEEFVANGDVNVNAYESTDQYCDNVQMIKDWTIKGLSGTCDESNEYLAKIEEFNQTFEFKFYPELECRIQKLRIRVWDCRMDVLKELASLEEANGTYEEQLAALMQEYNMGDRPGVCESEE